MKLPQSPVANPTLVLTDGLSYQIGQPGTRSYFRLQVSHFQVRAGEWVVIAGPTGTGKSTFLHTVGMGRQGWQAQRFTLVEPRQTGDGPAVHDICALYSQRQGRKIEALRRHTLGHALQKPELFPALTVGENIAISLHLNRQHGIRQRVDQLLTAVARSDGDDEMLDKRNSRIWELSGGQQQRVALCRAVAHGPVLLLADEPTSNLDRHTAQRVLAFLQWVRQHEGTAIIMVTHDESLVLPFADRLVRLDQDDKGVSRIVHEEVLSPASPVHA